MGSRDYSSWAPFRTVLIRSTYETFHVPYDPARGLILVVPYDCLGSPGKHVSVEAWLNFPDGPSPCGDCEIAYEDFDYHAVTSSELSTRGRQAYIANVPSGLTSVVVRATQAPSKVISVVNVKAGGVQVVRAFPASREQLTASPDG
jgi:hypothetical protein